MYISRILSQTIKKKIQIAGKTKAIILYGPRQAGKTTLIKKLIEDSSFKTLSINADEMKYVDVLGSRDLAQLTSLVSGYELLFIDEAQRIPEIGLNLKILIDNIPKLKIIAIGSSSFELASKINEPLTGRAWTYVLYPISFLELSATQNEFELIQELPERLVYGSYPEIFSIENNEEKRQYLEHLAVSSLSKDILELAFIKHSSKIRDLLKLLSFQVGSQVSLNELGRALGMGKDTVEHYIDLLEKSFVIFRLSGFSRNLHKEVTKMDKIYFYDLGIRNVFIDNLKPLQDRDDVGKLWENFLIIERMKLLHYTGQSRAAYFWRTHTGAELDYVEEGEGKLFGYQFTYGKKRSRIPQTWLSTYSGSSVDVIHRENFLKFITHY